MVDSGQMASNIMAEKAKSQHVDADRSAVQVASRKRRLRILHRQQVHSTLRFDSPTSTKKGDPLSAVVAPSRTPNFRYSNFVSISAAFRQTAKSNKTESFFLKCLRWYAASITRLVPTALSLLTERSMPRGQQHIVTSSSLLW